MNTNSDASDKRQEFSACETVAAATRALRSRVGVVTAIEVQVQVQVQDSPEH